MGCRRALAGALCVIMLALATVASAGATSSPRVMRLACADADSVLRFVASRSGCNRTLVEWTADRPVWVCRAPGTARVRLVDTARGCGSKAATASLPRPRPTRFCTTRTSRTLRWTARCRRGEARVLLRRRSAHERPVRRLLLVADNATTDEHHGVVVPVLANDRASSRGRRLRVVRVAGGESIGDVTLDDAGRVSYDPAGRLGPLSAGQTVVERFSYWASDGVRRGSGTLSVLVTGADGIESPPPAPPPVSVVADPGLEPGFSEGISDYVTRCTAGDPVEMDVTAPPGTSVSVDGNPPGDASVDLEPGQAFRITVTRAGSTTVHHVRCLPTDFTPYDATVAGHPQAEWYLVTRALGSPTTSWVMIFNAQGVPVWWKRRGQRPADFKLLPNGNLGWFSQDDTGDNAFDEVALDGELVRSTETVGTPTDEHDYQALPNGNRYLVSYKLRDHVDVSAYSGKTEDNDAAVEDAEVQELDPSGAVVWSWNSKDHVALAETGRWWSGPSRKTQDDRNLYDITHINAVEPDGDGIIISLRNTDALYRIDKATGAIDWKLGGTPTPASLALVDDPRGATSFGGQHDPRLLPDGTLTVHDNGTNRGRPPRAVRYEIDGVMGTATLVESVDDPLVPASPCCGSSRKLPTGNWVVSWGGAPLVTELAPDGSRPFKLTFPPGSFSYRAHPVMPGVLSAADLRAGMDAQYPR